VAGLGEQLALMVASEPDGEIVVYRHSLLLPVRAAYRLPLTCATNAWLEIRQAIGRISHWTSAG
jgi:hypothetical protein